ncbi:MAG TPA: urea transporter, partial [Bacteroidia bacterium]
MQENLKRTSAFYYNALVNSYSQIFFSDNRWFGVLLLLASFLDPFTGISGLLAVVVTAIFAKWFGFNPEQTKNGSYGFNSLLVGLLMGVHFKLNLPFFLILALISLLTLLLTVSFAALTEKNKIPFLSLPFLAAAWIVLLSVRNYTSLGLSERGIYTMNELSSIGGTGLVKFYETINSLQIPLFIEVYLKSLGAIFFQYNILAGLIIAAGLIICSRIAFSLSLLGFTTGYLFYYFVQGNISEMQYSFIGFNFILSAIALGVFFLIPSVKSYLLVVLITPLIGILISAFSNIFNSFQLPVYTLPFNFIVLLILFVLYLRTSAKKLELVLVQQFSPEKNLYKHRNNLERFRNNTYFHIHFPFFGEWLVTQGHNGKQTHKAEWRYAWDFVVADETKKTFRPPGETVTDFYCYG